MYSNILVPVDGSTTSLKGLQEAIKIAKAFGAKLTLVHVVNELIINDGLAMSMNFDRLIDSLREGGKKVLAAAQATVRQHDLTAQTELIETIGGRAADPIIEAAKGSKADLIVMGTHGRRGIRRLTMGSDAELVLRQSPVPVLMVREAPEA